MPNSYIPIVRPGPNEKEVIRNFGGLSRFGDSDHLHALRPIVEVGSDSDLQNLAPFREAASDIFVELPEYLTEQTTAYTKPVNTTLEKYGSREEFYRANSNKIDIPVISGYSESPVEYGIHKSLHLGLEGTFPSIVHRIMLRATECGLSEEQRSMLLELDEIARPESDIILIDVIDVGYQEGGHLYRDIQWLTEIFHEFERGILNVFDPYEGQPENVTPRVADQLNCESFGDFAVDRRYPPAGGGRPPVVYLKHYHPDHGHIEEFEGTNYEEAASELLGWAEYEASHCEFCRRAVRAVEQNKARNPSLWKQIRMGHYIESALQGVS